MIPPRSLLAVNPFFALALCILMAAGCNAFGFMYEDGASDDPDVILGDARIAMQDGNPEKAVELLEKALEKAPDNQEIKIELASALFQANEIDLLMMKDLADFIADAEPNIISKISISQNSNTCNFTGSSSSARPLQFEAEEAYIDLLNNTETLSRTLELLAQSFDISLSPDVADHFIGNAYLMRAIATMGTSVLDIKAKADSLDATLYQRSGHIGYCAPTPSALAEIEAFVLCEQLPVFDAAIEDLLYRQSLLGIQDSELVEAVGNARNELNNTTSLSCSPFYPASE